MAMSSFNEILKGKMGQGTRANPEESQHLRVV